MERIKKLSSGVLDSLFQGVLRGFNKAFGDDLAAQYYWCSESACVVIGALSFLS